MNSADATNESRNEQEKAPACIPFYAHENTMEHYNTANERMLIALLAVCVTFILTIIIFVFGYTVREKNWLDTLAHLQKAPITEVQSGEQAE